MNHILKNIIFKMQDSRLVQAFEALSRKEVRSLAQFVRSPFFNQKEAVVRLLDYLEECKFVLQIYPEKEKAFAKAFQGTTFHDATLRKCMSQLMKLLEQFLVWQRVAENEVRKNIELAEAYRHRNLNKHFSQVLRSLKTMQESRAIQNAEYYQDNYRIQLEEYEFRVKNKRFGDLNIQEISDSIDIVYLASKLRQTCFALAHLTVNKAAYDFRQLPALLLQAEQYLHIPAVALYYYCYGAIKEDRDEDFQAFKQLIFKHTSTFPLGEMRGLYLMALNFCIKRYNSGQQIYGEECFELYRVGLEQDFLLEEGKLSHFTYNNIVSIGLSIGKLDWTEQFIQGYKSAIPKRHRSNSYNFNLARLLYEKKDYDAALLLLQRYEYKDLLLNLSAKTTMLKIYYEIGAFDLLYSHLEALKTFIKRKKVMGYHQINYLNIVRFAKLLLELPPGDRAARAKLKADILITSSVAEKQWLLRQVEAS